MSEPRKLDRSRPFGETVGANTHAFEQDGFGFDGLGNCVGRVDYENNSLVPFAAAAPAGEPEPAPSLAPAPAPAPQTNGASEPNSNANGNGQEPSAGAEGLINPDDYPNFPKFRKVVREATGKVPKNKVEALQFLKEAGKLPA